MATKVSCPAGHEFEPEASGSGAAPRCPVCGQTVTIIRAGDGSVDAKPGRGLWQMMGRTATPSSPPHDPDALDAEERVERPAVDELVAESRVSASQREVASTSQPDSPPIRRGLWDMMGRRDIAERETEHVAERESPTTTRDDDAASPPEPAVATLDDAPADNLVSETIQPQSLGLEDFVSGVRQTPRPKTGVSGVISLVLGLLSLPLAIPALFDQSPLVFVPSGVLGFVALCFGLATMSTIRRGRVTTKGRGFGLVGMAAGVLAMFLGPVVLSGVGKRMAAESRRSFTEGHLKQLGEGLQAYHNAKGMFPPGGVFKPVAGGTEQGLHGWMTLLLPYLGEQELYNRIDLQKPFSDEANLAAMGSDLPVFWSAGADRAKVAGKFGVAHIAGVGGDFVNEDGEQVEAGIFAENSEITRDQVTDGLSNTIVAGEVPAHFPAWGDPENWRQVGRGLNQDPDGFGNVEGTGAMFLMGDGSVRFISRATNRRVLEALSTRSSGDQ